MAEQPTPLQLVELISEATDALIKNPPSDDELADVIGHMDRIATKLRNTRLKWERIVHELPPIPKEDRVRKVTRKTATPRAQGRDFELVPQFTIVRSYNTQAIFAEIQRETGKATLDLILELNRADALRFKWQWTNLKKYLRSVRVPLKLAYVEVSDEDGTDGFMVGEIEKPAGVKKVYIDERVAPEEQPPDPEPDPDGDVVPFHPMAPGDEIGGPDAVGDSSVETE